MTAVVPLANARTALAATPLTLTFSQPLTPASAQALKVFSHQRGGLRTKAATPATVSGNTLRFTPTAFPFSAGETVFYTATARATNASGVPIPARVGQFTVAAGGTGNFLPGSESAGLADLTLGDVDGDGDLDMLTAGPVHGSSGQVTVQLNEGQASFSGFSNSQKVAVGYVPYCMALGDIDGDGDLDMLVGTRNTLDYIRVPNGNVDVCFNDGTGRFARKYGVYTTDFPQRMALGDVDGDGDLDFLVTTHVNNTSVRLNDGTGVFTAGQLLSNGADDIALGDVDNDGDLDLLAATVASAGNKVSVHLNNGSGSFAPGSEVAIGQGEHNLLVGDIDGDGDLDLVASNVASKSISIRVNNGNGVFTGTQELVTPYSYIVASISLSDVDGDGDFDVLMATKPGVLVYNNNGSGLFTAAQEVPVRNSVENIALGDVDSDGDLDLLASNTFSMTTLSLNGGTTLAATASAVQAENAVFPNPVARGATVSLAAVKSGTAVEVLDAVGRIVLSVRASATGTVQLALPSGVPAGLYLVRSNGHTHRLVIQ